MILEVFFWVSKIAIFILLVFICLRSVVGKFPRKESFFRIFSIVFLLYVLFVKGTVVKSQADFSDCAQNFDYISQQVDLYGNYEMGYKKLERQTNTAHLYYYKFDGKKDYKSSYISESVEQWKLNEKQIIDEVTYRYSKLELHRESSYLNAYTGWYRGVIQLEKKEEIIVVDYAIKAPFKWYDYIIIFNEPTITDGFIIKSLAV